MDDLFEERMSCAAGHEVVAHTPGMCLGKEGVILQKRSQVFVAADVEVNVDAAKVVKDEVANSIDALDVVWVLQVDAKEPRVVLFDESLSIRICPEHVLPIVLMKGLASFLRMEPRLWHICRFEGLVNDARNLSSGAS